MAISGKNKYPHIAQNYGNRVRNNYLKGYIMTYLPIAILSINLCCFLFDLIFPSNKYWKTHFLKLPVLLQKLFVFITVGPLFIAPVIPQSRFNISNIFSLPIGILLFVLGWIVIIFAFLKIGVIPAIRKKSDLITSGIYGLIRHPIYSGTLIAVLGWTILFKSIISMIYFPLLCLLYIVATILEEKGLIEEYGDEYINYKKKVTKRFIPYIL
jgi:protein-S-isoprenylcysteine O-methyltransferase Ste14